MRKITQPLIAIAIFLCSAQIFSQGTLQVTGNAIVINSGDITPSTADDTDFGNVSIGFNNPNTFVIDNTAGGGSPGNQLNGITVTITGVHAADFTPNVANLGNLKGNDAPLNHVITFTPSATGLRTATVTITFTNGTNSPYTFDIQGTGLTPAPEIDITGLGVSIVDGDTTPSTTDDTDYGSSPVSTPVAHTFTIHNTGTLTLNVGTITVSGTNAGDFVVTTPPSTTVAAGATTTFILTFTPSAGGNRTASISIANDDSDENPYNFDVQGSAPYPPPKYCYYLEDFDASNGGWTIITSTNDTWTWTTTFPISVTDEMAEGGFWRSNNYNNYADNTNIVIESPALDFTGLQNLLLSLDVNYDTENGVDGMRVLYSVGGGAFTVLGTSADGTNWYDDNTSALGTDGWNNDSHPNSPAFSGRYSHFKNAEIQLDSGTFDNQSNVKFRIEFSSNGSGTDDGVAFDNFRIQADPTSALSDAFIAPANITSNLRLWLKSDAGIAMTDGAALTTWEDQAYATALDKEDATASSALAPTYRDNSTRNINYNPVADFNNSNTEYMNGKGGFYSQDYFVVTKSDDIVDTQTGTFSPGRQFPMGGRSDMANYHEDPTGLAFGSSTARYVNEVIAHNMGAYSQSGSPGVDSYGRAYTSATDTFNHVLIINVKANSGATAKEIYKNGKRIDNATGTTGTSGTGTPLNYYEFNNLHYLVGAGRSGLTGRTTSQLNGMLSEVISYDAPNSALNQQKIQSYLGIKYGVTLQDPASSLTNYRVNDVDYIDSSGNVIWDTSANSAYNYDVAGIGRDDASQLLQKQSKSQNLETDGTGPTSGFLTMGLTQIYNTNNENIVTNGTTFNDQQFLVWGNNNASLDGTATTISVDMSTDLGDPTLTTWVDFTAIPRIWKVIEINGDVPSVEVSIPTSIVRTAAPPDGRYLMFISATGVFDPTADYRVMTETGGMLYTDYDFDGTEYITFGWAPEQVFDRSVYFDPTHSDYIDVEDNLDLDPTGFTISAWIKRDVNSTNKSIISKRDTGFSEGYDFKISTTGRFEVRWRDLSGSLQFLVSSVAIPVNEWHHLAVTYNGSVGTLYIDGIADTSATRTAPVATTQSFFIGAAGKNSPTAFFHGNIDEVRVWDSALTADQLRFIMNQEIEENSTFVAGKYFQD
ncbi:MAG: choice-of-anchor D domain-containing protein, partial [Flavobacteriaceae bacterium]|nr:choice-of-anchor D domain-containing protein [Flavobacteriaceae bacterium]